MPYFFTSRLDCSGLYRSLEELERNVEEYRRAAEPVTADELIRREEVQGTTLGPEDSTEVGRGGGSLLKGAPRPVLEEDE
jgi:hypothetical protein